MTSLAAVTRIRSTLVLAVSIVVPLISACEGGTPNNVNNNPLTLFVTPTGPVSLSIGQTATLVGSPGLGNGTLVGVSYTSSDPNIASVSATTGLVIAVSPGTATITVKAEQAANAPVSLPVTIIVTAPTLTFNTVRSALGGATLPNTSVKGAVNVFYDVTNPPAGGGVSVRLGDSPFINCDPLTSTTTQIRCPVNTADVEPTTLTPKFRNGATTISARATTAAGTQVAVITTPLTLTNSDFFKVTTNDPPNPGGAVLWRAGDITVTVQPVIFSNNTTNPTVGLTVVRLDGSGTLNLNQTQPIGPPYTFTINPATSGNAEGIFTFTPRAFSGGNDISSGFEITSFNSNVDLLAPRTTLSAFPATTLISVPAINLGHTTGPYPAGTIIPLSRIVGGQQIGKHLPNCDATHIHGNITILRETTGSDGPFADPEFTFSDPCGHGKVVLQSLDHVDLNFSGTLTDGSPPSARFKLFFGTNGCDTGPLNDDIPIPTGTGPGQSPTPEQIFTQPGAFNSPFRVYVSPTVANRDICVRTDAHDSAVNAQGQNTNTTARGDFMTRIVESFLQ